jgi:hypothetical protein
MPEPRTSQDLFNKVADILDFTPEKYNQGVWGNAAIKYVGIDPEYIEWDDVSMDGDELNLTPSDLKEKGRKDDACGTQACVAGWACLLSGLHPTLVKLELDDSPNDYVGSIVKRISGKVSELFSSKWGFNYNVMCNNPDVKLPDYENRGRSLQMDDIRSDEGIAIGGNIFYRPDFMGRVLLSLDHDEAQTLFDGDFEWEADDLRMIGKGENVDELLEARFGEEFCTDCSRSHGNCEC